MDFRRKTGTPNVLIQTLEGYPQITSMKPSMTKYWSLKGIIKGETFRFQLRAASMKAFMDVAWRKTFATKHQLAAPHFPFPAAFFVCYVVPVLAICSL